MLSNLFSSLTQFHFLRPLWLLALLPSFLLIYRLQTIRSLRTDWEKVIAPHLLKVLLIAANHKHSKTIASLLLMGWLLAIFALAGPTYKQLPVPAGKKSDALIILLDLSPSMQAQDVTTSRLMRAKYKLRDILQQRKGGLTALIAYAGDAHVVTPLTDDIENIVALLPALAPDTMPVPGSEPIPAFQLAEHLLTQAGYSKGQILLITDGIAPPQLPSIENYFSHRKNAAEITFSILGVGTPTGAPIPLANGSFLKADNGEIIIPHFDSKPLRSLAQKHQGNYTDLKADDSDIQLLFSQFTLPDQSTLSDQSTQKLHSSLQQWQELGLYLIWILLPIAALAFRRGWLSPLMVLLFITALSPHLAYADIAQGVTYYRNKQYQQAANEFSQQKNADGWYNKANALAQLKNYPAAIQAYDQALQLNPKMEDAQFNKQLIERLLKQQQEQQQKQQQSSQTQKSAQEKSSDQTKKSQSKKIPPSPPLSKGGTKQQQHLAKQQAKQKQDAELQQWLQKVPDDPSGLLRRKFQLQWEKSSQQQVPKKIYW